MLVQAATLLFFATFITTSAADADSFATSSANSAMAAYNRGLDRIDGTYRREQVDVLKKYQNELKKEASSSKRSGNQDELRQIEAIQQKTEAIVKKLEEASSGSETVDVGAAQLNKPGTAAFERAMARLDEKHRRDTLRLLADHIRKMATSQKTAIRKGDKADADKITLVLDNARNQHQQLISQPPRGGRDIVVSAKDGAGSTRVSLGSLKKGRTLRIQYISGKWTDYPRATLGSPDDLKLINENVVRPRLCAVVGEKVIPLIVIRSGTARKPLAFKIPRDIANLVLNNSDPKAGNNLGEVTYRVWIEY